VKHTVSILVENKPGVLMRVSSLFSRRGYNIHSLAVGTTEVPDVSRMTVVVDLPDKPLEHVTKQLHKLINVLKIRDLEPEEMVARELALFKLSADSETRAQILHYAEIFRGKVVDVTKRAVMTCCVNGDGAGSDELPELSGKH